MKMEKKKPKVKVEKKSRKNSMSVKTVLVQFFYLQPKK